MVGFSKAGLLRAVLAQEVGNGEEDSAPATVPKDNSETVPKDGGKDVGSGAASSKHAVKEGGEEDGNGNEGAEEEEPEEDCCVADDVD